MKSCGIFITLAAALVGALSTVYTSPAQTTAPEEQALDDLVLANRVLASNALQILDTRGHVSVRNPRNPNRYFIARYIAPGTVTRADIYEADLDSNPVAGNRNDVYNERFIHGEIYRTRPDVNAIVHAHTPELVAFSVSSVALHTGGDPLPTFDIRNLTGGKMGTITTPALGKALAQSLGRSPAVLLLGHGVVIVDASIVGLVNRAAALREDAVTQINATALGGKVGYLDFKPRPAPDAAAMASQAAIRGGMRPVSRPWEYWTRLVGSESHAAAPSVSSPSPMEELALANRILSTAELGILGAFGHVSLRDPWNSNRYFISRDVSPGIVTAADIYESDLDSRPVSGDPTRYSERFIHGEIYKARPDVNAIVHAHTAELVAFGQSSVPLRAVTNAATFIGPGLPNYDIRAFTGGFPSPVGCGHCISTPELGRALADVLGKSGAALLFGHGIVVVDSSLPDLVSRSYNLRMNARIQQIAIALGGTVTYIDAPARGTSGGAEFNRDWDYWKRLVSLK